MTDIIVGCCLIVACVLVLLVWGLCRAAARADDALWSAPYPTDAETQAEVEALRADIAAFERGEVA